MENRHQIFMDNALELASSALDKGEFPVGCVLVSGDKIVGRGSRVHTIYHERNELDHAEILAIRDWLSRGGPESQELVAYTTLEPCLMCFGALVLHGVRKIVYAYEDIMGGATGLDLSDPLSGAARSGKWRSTAQRHFLYNGGGIEIVSGVRRHESLSLFKKFFSDEANGYWRDSLLARYTLEVK